jgi:hypothetical protein
MFHNIQCSTSSVPLPTAASRSRAMSTKLTVLSGALLHDNGGETWSPACVNLTGMIPPSGHALLLRVITWIAPRR